MAVNPVCYMEPVLTHGCESWSIDKDANKKSLAAIDFDFKYIMLKILLTAKLATIM